MAFGKRPAHSERQAVLLRGRITQQADVRYDRAHLARFCDSALEYEAVYYLRSALALPERIEHAAAAGSEEEAEPALASQRG